MLSSKLVSRRQYGRMRARRALSRALAIVLILVQVPVAASETSPERIGINRVNLAWLSRDDQKRVLTEMAAGGGPMSGFRCRGR